MTVAIFKIWKREGGWGGREWLMALGGKSAILEFYYFFRILEFIGLFICVIRKLLNIGSAEVEVVLTELITAQACIIHILVKALVLSRPVF